MLSGNTDKLFLADNQGTARPNAIVIAKPNVIPNKKEKLIITFQIL